MIVVVRGRVARGEEVELARDSKGRLKHGAVTLDVASKAAPGVGGDDAQVVANRKVGGVGEGLQSVGQGACVALQEFRGRMDTLQATPVTPVALLPTAPTVPATWVP